MRIAEWFANLCRPWYGSVVPEHLSFPPVDNSQFAREYMLRQAGLSVSCEMPFGIFGLLGMEAARHAAGCWRPGAILASEEVSLAFMLVEEQRLLGEIVSRLNVQRLAVTLEAYFQRSGRPRERTAIIEQIQNYIASGSLPDAENISPVRRKVAVRLPLLHELRAIDEEIRRTIIGMHNRPASLFDVGLGLNKELDQSRYNHCTPLNVRTFAHTGGDGAHFSFLVQDDAITETSPVVVTLPGAHGLPSVVAAESLHDFLCLGCLKGYFALGFVPYGPESRHNEYVGPEGELPISDYLTADYNLQILALLRERFGLKPWTSSRKFAELQQRYGPLLRYPPGAIFG